MWDKARTLSQKVWDRARRPRRHGRRARPALRRPPPDPRGHHAPGLRRAAAGRAHRPPARPHPGHGRPQHAHHRPRPAPHRPHLGPPARRPSPTTAPSSGSRSTRWAPGQGIVHVIGPELGLTQPGMTIVCGDSHTSTHGAFGALAFGIGTSEVEHVLATQTLPGRRPGTMAITVDGDLPAGRHGQGRDPRHHRPDRHRRRHRPHRRVPGLGHPRPLDGGPDDDLQHVDRGRRQGRDGRPGRHHVRLPRGPRPRPQGHGLGAGARRLAGAGHRRRRHVRPGGRLRRRRHGAARLVGHQPGPGRAHRRCRARPRRHRRPDAGRGRPAGAGLHGPHRRHADARHRRRHRLHRLVHQHPPRRPAGRGRRSSAAATCAPGCGRWSCPARCG